VTGGLQSGASAGGSLRSSSLLGVTQDHSMHFKGESEQPINQTTNSNNSHHASTGGGDGGDSWPCPATLHSAYLSLHPLDSLRWHAWPASVTAFVRLKRAHQQTTQLLWVEELRPLQQVDVPKHCFLEHLQASKDHSSRYQGVL